jgi:hypothetical protein
MFLSARGWSLITHLASCILIEISAPQNGVKQMFITGRNDIVAKQIFRRLFVPMILWHAIKITDFKNDPSVSSEYVKFLIMNTGMDLADQVIKENAVLEEHVTELAKGAKVADARASSASKGASLAQEAVKGLAKQVAALESKNRIWLVYQFARVLHQ